MKKFEKCLVAVGLWFIAGVGTYTNYVRYNKPLPPPPAWTKVRQIIGKPLSVDTMGGYYSNHYGEVGSLSVVIKDPDGKRILASVFPSYDEKRYFSQYTDLAALIQAEISDGDDEQIRLEGRYEREDYFKIDIAHVGSYSINLNPRK